MVAVSTVPLGIQSSHLESFVPGMDGNTEQWLVTSLAGD